MDARGMEQNEQAWEARLAAVREQAQKWNREADRYLAQRDILYVALRQIEEGHEPMAGALAARALQQADNLDQAGARS